MQKVSLYIQPQVGLNSTQETTQFVNVDLMEEELISITQVIKDLNNLDKVFTDYSRTFNLPASKTNNKIFKFWYNSDVVGFNSNTYCEARIYLNHQAFRDGKIKLNSVVMKNNKPYLYKITFFGNTTTLTDRFKDDELSDLVWLNEFNHSASTTNVRSYLESGLNVTVSGVTYNNAIKYPLLAHSQAYIFNENGDTSNGMNISTASTNNLNRGVVAEDLKPAIKLSLILKAIEQQYGIIFQTGNSNFFDTSNNSVFDNLYMWLHRDKGKMAAAGTLIGNSNPYNGSGDVTEMTNQAGTYGYFQAGSGIWYNRLTNYSNVTYKDNKLRITYTITPTSGTNTAEYTLQVLNATKWSVLTEKQKLTGTNSIVFEIGYAFYEMPNPADSYYAQGFGSAYDYAPIVFRVIAENSIAVGIQQEITRTVEYTIGDSNSSTTFNHTATFTSQSTSITPQDALVEITDQVPKMKVKDFLRGLMQQFNLVSYVDELTNDIVVKTLDQYYSEGNQVDITKYVTVDTHEVDSVIPYSEVKFCYSDPKSILAEQYENLNNKKFGEERYNSDSDENKVFEVKLPFEHMMYERLRKLDTGVESSVQTGSFINQDLKPSKGAPLILYIVNVSSNLNRINFVDSSRNSDVLGALFQTGTARHDVSNYNAPMNYNSTGSGTVAPTHNLNFGSEINEYQLFDYNGDNNSLFLTYYRNYILRIYNIKSRLIKTNAVLPLEVLTRLKLNDLIVIGTKAYTINKMTTKLQSGKTTLELLSEPDYAVTTETANMSYSTSTACQNASDLTPTFSPTGGTFTAS